MKKATQTKKPNILVVDDDPILRRTLIALAKKQGIPMTVCGSVVELNQLESDKEFDVALIDYYLDEFNGADVASLLGSTPVVMMSAKTSDAIEENFEWPATVRKFVNKSDGIESLLTTAIQVSHSEKRSK